jgi:hypothetical protein
VEPILDVEHVTQQGGLAWPNTCRNNGVNNLARWSHSNRSLGLCACQGTDRTEYATRRDSRARRLIGDMEILGVVVIVAEIPEHMEAIYDIKYILTRVRRGAWLVADATTVSEIDLHALNHKACDGRITAS